MGRKCLGRLFFLGAIACGLVSWATAADVQIGNDDVSVSGQVFDNYSFMAGGTGRLLMAPGTRQFGNVTLHRDSIIYSNGAFELVREDSGRGITNTELNLNGHELRIFSDLQPRTAGESPWFYIWDGKIVGGGSIVAPAHTVSLMGGDSSGSSASIRAMGISIGVPDHFLPTGEFTVSEVIILSTSIDTGKDFRCTGPVGVFANIDEASGDYEIRFTGRLQFEDDVHFRDGRDWDWGRGVAFSAPSHITDPNQTTVTYYVGPNTFQFTDSLAVCGGIRGENGRVVYGTVKVDSLDWLRNAGGRFINLGFAGGKLDLTSTGQTVFDFREGVHFGSFSVRGHPGGGIFVLPDNSTLLLNAERVHLDEGVLEVEGENLTVIVDCQDSVFSPSRFGGFKLPPNATLRFINVEGDTVASGNLEGEGSVDAEGRNLHVGSDIEDTSAVPDEEKEFTGRIENVSELNKVGQGTTTFGEGATIEAESAKVSEGTLIVNTDAFRLNGGSGTLEVSGGTLMGSGTIMGNLVVGAEGEYRPGTSINTQHVTGNFTLQGTAEIEVRPLGSGSTQGTPGTDNDLIRVGGRVTLNPGAAVHVVEDSDYVGTDGYKKGDRYYFLLSEANDIQGSEELTFWDDLPDVHIGAFGLTDPDTPLGGLQGRWIWFELDEGDFFGNTPNTRAVARLLNRLIQLGVLSEFTEILLELYPQEQLVALQQIAGESVGTSMNMVVQNTTIVSEFLSRQIRPSLWQSAGGSGGLTQVSGSGSVPIVFCGGPDCRCPVWTPWAVGYGLGGAMFGDGNTSSALVSTGGLLVGLERILACDTRAGLFYSYGQSSTNVSALQAAVTTDDHLWGGYLVRKLVRSYLLAAAGLGYDHYTSRRIISVDDYTEVLRSRHGGWQSVVYGEYGLNIQSCVAVLQPYFGLRYIHLRQNGFDESPTGFAALSVDPVDLDSLRTQLGARIGLHRLGGRDMLLEGRAAWVHELLDQTAPVYYASLAAVPVAGSFSARGVDLGRDFAWVGVGLGWQMTKVVQIRGDYDLLFNERETLHTGSASLICQW